MTIDESKPLCFEIKSERPADGPVTVWLEPYDTGVLLKARRGNVETGVALLQNNGSLYLWHTSNLAAVGLLLADDSKWRVKTTTCRDD